jgi:hypothetical protein
MAAALAPSAVWGPPGVAAGDDSDTVSELASGAAAALDKYPSQPGYRYQFVHD